MGDAKPGQAVRCPLCHELAARKVVKYKIENMGRIYYKCQPCDKWICWEDDLRASGGRAGAFDTQDDDDGDVEFLFEVKKQRAMPRNGTAFAPRTPEQQKQQQQAQAGTTQGNPYYATSAPSTRIPPPRRPAAAGEQPAQPATPVNHSAARDAGASAARPGMVPTGRDTADTPTRQKRSGVPTQEHQRTAQPDQQQKEDRPRGYPGQQQQPPGVKRKLADAFDDVEETSPKRQAPPNPKPAPAPAPANTNAHGSGFSQAENVALRSMAMDNARLRQQLQQMDAMLQAERHAQQRSRDTIIALEVQVTTLRMMVANMEGQIVHMQEELARYRARMARDQQQQQQQQQQQRPSGAATGNGAERPQRTSRQPPGAGASAAPPPPHQQRRQQQQQQPPGSAGAQAGGPGDPPSWQQRQQQPHRRPGAAAGADPAAAASQEAPSTPGYPACEPPLIDDTCSVRMLKQFLSEAGAEALARFCSEKHELAALARERLNSWEVRRIVACSQMQPQAAGDAAAYRCPTSREQLRAVHRELQLRVHPDKCPGDELATPAFQYLQGAFKRMLVTLKA